MDRVPVFTLAWTLIKQSSLWRPRSGGMHVPLSAALERAMCDVPVVSHLTGPLLGASVLRQAHQPSLLEASCSRPAFIGTLNAACEQSSNTSYLGRFGVPLSLVARSGQPSGVTDGPLQPAAQTPHRLSPQLLPPLAPATLHAAILWLLPASCGIAGHRQLQMRPCDHPFALCHQLAHARGSSGQGARLTLPCTCLPVLRISGPISTPVGLELC